MKRLLIITLVCISIAPLLNGVARVVMTKSINDKKTMVVTDKNGILTLDRAKVKKRLAKARDSGGHKEASIIHNGEKVILEKQEKESQQTTHLEKDLKLFL